MFEQIGNLLLSVDLMGMGVSIPLIALTIGIAYLLSKDMRGFSIIIIISNLALSLILFIGFKESTHFLLTAILTIITIMLPDGLFEKQTKKE